MVLRGSKINPEHSLLEAEEAIREAQQKLDEAKADLESAKRKTFESLSDTVLLTLDKSHLIELVQELRDKVHALEDERLKAEESYAESRRQLRNTLIQFGSGGIAGAVARTTVAPIDRVKIAMQTAAIKGLEAKYTYVLHSNQNKS